MNNFPNVLNIAKAVKHRSTFPLDFEHKTTFDFGKTTVLHAMEVIPNDVIDIDLSCVTQLAPLKVPTMGEVNLYVRAFFVPYRFIWKDWEAFFSQFSHRVGTTTSLEKVPVFKMFDLWSLFRSSVGTQNALLESTTADAKFDFKVSVPEPEYYIFTPLGRLYNQILQGLGYIVYPINQNDSNMSTLNKEFSALPLLTLVKVFRDYYVNPNYDYVTIDGYLNNNSWTVALTESQLQTMLEFVAYGWFEGDLFTQAWANPESVGYSSVFNQQSIIDTPYNDYLKSTIYNTQSSDPTYLQKNFGNYLTERGLNILKQVYNFSLRQAAAGARYVDQLLSRFGIKLNENEAKRCHFIGSAVFNTQISRVDATAAGYSPELGDLPEVSSALGDFSGRGVMTGNGHFHYENKHNDFGMIVFVAHLMPRTNYYQGFKPHCNHITFNHFFNPDLEDIGNAPIRQNEVYFDYRDADTVHNATAQLNGVFGFAPNYYDYKSQQSYLTGDFRVASLNEDLKAYQLFRTLRGPGEPDSSNASTAAFLSEQFQKFTPQNSGDWLRMFLTVSQDADHFIGSFVFRQRVTRDMNSLGNSLLAELNEHGDDVGDIIKVRPNGKYF